MDCKAVIRNVTRQIKRKSPLIFTVLTVGGVVATAVLSSKAALKADTKIRSLEADKGEELSTREKIAAALPIYIPTIAVTAATSLCAIESNILNKKQQAALTLAYAALQEKLKQYTNPVQLTEKTVTKPVYDLYPYTGEYLEAEGPYDTYYTYTFHDDISDCYYNRTVEEVLTALDQVVDIYERFGEVSINEFMDALGLDMQPYGDAVLWTKMEGREYYGSDFLAFTLYKMTSDDENAPPYIWIIPTFPPMAIG